MIRRHIPNAITCANLFSGSIGIVYAFNGQLETAAYFVLLSGVFDFFDGLAARALNVKSAIGKELDSLADVISFGFLPGVVMYQLLAQSDYTSSWLPYSGFFITVFSALRLAKFNTDTRQSEDFIGLNTPMNTIFIVSLVFIRADYPALTGSAGLLIGITALSCWLLVSEIRIFSMKLGSTGWKENKFRYLFLVLSLILAAIFQFMAVPLILLLYIVCSVFHFRDRQTVAP